MYSGEIKIAKQLDLVPVRTLASASSIASTSPQEGMHAVISGYLPKKKGPHKSIIQNMLRVSLSYMHAQKKAATIKSEDPFWMEEGWNDIFKVSIRIIL